ncbi:hypothetical protein SESBI_22316 [Sesbania bispinosa]|nr:hypothetical protein SESBI_22316 [Sesbania bispinosa]
MELETLILQVQLIAGPTKPASVLSKQSARNLELTAVLQLQTVSYLHVLMQHGASLWHQPLDGGLFLMGMMSWKIRRWILGLKRLEKGVDSLLRKRLLLG